MGLSEFPNYDASISARLASAVDRLVDEFGGLYTREQVRTVVDESAQQLGRGSVSPFVPVLAERFARERLRSQAVAEGRVEKEAPEVLFVSLTGGGRAQIGAALLARRAGDAATVHSAGSERVGEIDPNVRLAMEEIGIDLSDAFTKPLTPEVLAGADIVVTMGRSVGEVDLPGSVHHLDWRVGDPAGAELDEVRRVRDDIERRIDAFAAELLGHGQAVAAAD